MGKILSKKDAIVYTGLDPKAFDNYFKNAEEFKCMERNGSHGRFMFSEETRGMEKELCMAHYQFNKG